MMYAPMNSRSRPAMGKAVSQPPGDGEACPQVIAQPPVYRPAPQTVRMNPSQGESCPINVGLKGPQAPQQAPQRNQTPNQTLQQGQAPQANIRAANQTGPVNQMGPVHQAGQMNWTGQGTQAGQMNQPRQGNSQQAMPQGQPGWPQNPSNPMRMNNAMQGNRPMAGQGQRPSLVGGILGKVLNMKDPIGSLNKVMTILKLLG